MDTKIEAKPKKKIKKTTIVIWILILIILLMLAAGGVTYYLAQKRNVAAMEAAAALPVATVTVEKGLMSETLDDLSGTVRSNQSVSLYWQVAGTVSEVLVSAGDEVKKGDVLASLSTGTIDSSILDAAVTKETAEESLERIYTSSLDLATAYNTMITAKKAVKTAEDELSKLGVVRKDEVELGVYYQDYLDAKSFYSEALSEYDTLKVRPLDDVDRQMAASMLEGARSQMESTLSKYNWYNGEVDTLKKQQAEADLLLKQAQYADAVRAYEKIMNGPTSSQVAALTAQKNAAAATMKTANIIAPIDAIVSEVSAKPLDVIRSTAAGTVNEVLAVRLDDLSAYYIDVSVSELKIASLSVGQNVEIKFDAVPLKRYSGKVSNISNVGTVVNSVVTYAVTIRMDETDSNVRAGMMADLSIHTKEMPNALYVPATAVGVNAEGKSIVSKKNDDGTFTDLVVETGITADNNTQVISEELKAGDAVKQVLSAGAFPASLPSNMQPPVFMGF